MTCHAGVEALESEELSLPPLARTAGDIIAVLGVGGATEISHKIKQRLFAAQPLS